MYKFLFRPFLLIFLFVSAPLALSAQNEAAKGAITYEDMMLYVLIGLTALVLFITFFVLVLGIQVITLLLKQTTANPEDQQTFWQMVWGLKPLSKEKDLLLEEDYDGIQELDNPTPGWFNALFYGTIGIAVVYLLVYHVWNIGDLQEVEYTKEVEYAEVQKQEYLQKVASGIDENTVKLVSDEKSLTNGKEIFLKNCATCHGEQGEGKLGPNLTDKYWLYGGKINDVFKTIKYGAKNGMISWSKKLNPLVMQEVASYILSLQGSNPPNAKEPQGKEENVASK